MTISNNGPFFRDTTTDGCTGQDFFMLVPSEVLVNHIFPHLNLHELGVSCKVNKVWKQCASTPILWQSVVYHEIAFSSKNWAEIDADLVKDVEMKQEILSLPENIAEELSFSAFPGKSISETHVLVRMPKGLTIKKLGELAKKYFRISRNGYRSTREEILTELGDKSVEKPVWLLMTKDVLEGSACKLYDEQEPIVAQLAKKTGVPYQIPTTLEAATCILAEYFRSKIRLFGDNPYTYTRCQENIQSDQMNVGGFSSIGGLCLCAHNYIGDNFGVAALRKF